MEGYQLTFYTQINRWHKDDTIAEWITKQAKTLGVGGVTVEKAAGGYGHDGRYHSGNFFELGDQSVTVTMAVEKHTADSLLKAIRAEGVDVFYLKIPAEFGRTGQAKA